MYIWDLINNNGGGGGYVNSENGGSGYGKGGEGKLASSKPTDMIYVYIYLMKDMAMMEAVELNMETMDEHDLVCYIYYVFLLKYTNFVCLGV